MLRETRKNALKNSGFEVRVLVDLVENDGGFVLGPYSQLIGGWENLSEFCSIRLSSTLFFIFNLSSQNESVMLFHFFTCG